MQQVQAQSARRSRTERLIRALLRRFVLIVGVLAVWCYVLIYTRPEAPAPIRSDGFSYYVYLPSWLLYGDFTLDGPARDWYGGSYPSVTGVVRWPGTSRWVNPHPIGPAILMTPFFAIAHGLTRWSNLPPDGFSLYYQHAAGLAGLTALLAGLAVLRSLLTRRYTDGVALATLVAVTWGTNLFHYGVYDSVFSHAFSFALVCAFVALTERWWSAPTWITSVAVGMVAAGIVLTRHTNVLFLAILPLYGVTGWRSLGQQIRRLVDRRVSLLLIALTAAAVFSPQLAIYRAATGSSWVSPYAALGVGFTFDSPHLAGVLFSPQKGLFFWSPLLLLAVAGLFVAARTPSWPLLVPTVAILAIDTYLIASWHDWQFGGGYGHRGFTDGMGLFALFLASFFHWAAERPRLHTPVATIVSLAVLLSVAQMAQYWMGILPIGDTTWAQYRALFLTFR